MNGLARATTPGSSEISVRGTTAITYRTSETTANLIWAERPGVLLWIKTPVEREAELPAIAEGLQRVDGPATLPSRLVVAGTGEPYDASSNDGDALIVGKRDGAECTGWAYIDDCSNAIDADPLCSPAAFPGQTSAG